MDTQEQIKLLMDEQKRAHSFSTSPHFQSQKEVKSSSHNAEQNFLSSNQERGHKKRNESKRSSYKSAKDAVGETSETRHGLTRLAFYFILACVVYMLGNMDDPIEFLMDLPAQVFQTEEVLERSHENNKEDEVHTPKQETQETQEVKVDPGSAIGQAKAFAESNPDSAQAWTTLGDAYYAEQMPEEAVGAYTKSLELSPHNVNVLIDRGNMYRELQQYDLALAGYDLALKLDPKNEFALLNAGIVLHYDLNRNAEAKEKWQQLLQLNPDIKTFDGLAIKDLIQNL